MRDHRLVHFVSDRSLLSVVVPVKTLKTVLDRHIASLDDLLCDLAVPPAIVKAELDEMRDRAVGSTQSSNVLASVRELAMNVRRILAGAPRASPLEVSRELARTPLGPSPIASPADVAIGLLLKRHSDPTRGMRGA
jgi:hypothetical protein